MTTAGAMEFYKGYGIEIEMDDEPQEYPRDERFSFGTLVAWDTGATGFGRRHPIGDKLAKEMGSLARWAYEMWYEQYGRTYNEEHAFQPISEDMRRHVERERFAYRTYTWGDFEHDLDNETDEAVGEAIARWLRTGVVAVPVWSTLSASSSAGIAAGDASDIDGLHRNDPYPSGLIGFCYATPDEIRAEFECKHITAKITQNAVAYLTAEIQAVGRWMMGEYYCFRIHDKAFEGEWGDCELEDDSEEVDSLSGLDDEDYALQAAKEAIDGMVEKEGVQA